MFAGLAWIMLSGSLLRPRQELLYSLSPLFAQCPQAAGDRCVAYYRLALGNSGSATLGLVRVQWPAQLAAWRLDWSASDLVGSARPRADPQVREAGPGLQEVVDLEPNTHLALRLQCLDCTRAQLRALGEVKVNVEAPGRVVETEPRMTIFGRLVLNATRLAGYLF